MDFHSPADLKQPGFDLYDPMKLSGLTEKNLYVSETVQFKAPLFRVKCICMFLNEEEVSHVESC